METSYQITQAGPLLKLISLAKMDGFNTKSYITF